MWKELEPQERAKVGFVIKRPSPSPDEVGLQNCQLISCCLRHAACARQYEAMAKGDQERYRSELAAAPAK